MLEIFENYNQDIWPMQIIAYLLGFGALYFTIIPAKFSNQIISGILAFLWLWTGILFFEFYFGPVYKPAYVFGGLFIIQGLLFLLSILRKQLHYGFRINIYSVVGILFIVYAMIGYPVIGYFLDHVYPQSPAFGLTPCPLTIFTLGMILLTIKKVPKYLLIITLLWAISGIMPVSIGILEDIGLISAGIIGTIMILVRDRKRSVKF
jgi:hypothetical protein